MNRSFIGAVCLTGVMITGACSSAENNSTAKAGPNQNANGTQVAVSTGDSVTAPQAADANAAPTDETSQIQSPMANKMEAKLKAIQNATEPIDNAKVEEMARKTGRPAPDNSIFYSFLTDAGYEVREFKDNPQLLKAEKRIGSDKQTLKVFLRGGRVVELAGNAVTPLATASANTILVAAGVQPKPLPQKPVPPASGPGKDPGQ